ncbi:Panacea domain-containing protein [Candidatus Phytoplasma pruni]|uniref:DUF4065 domain-containing protein n=1 Tax=Candidatus Phytoplasma pruni TaxID=479893 RepID=A0A851HAD3_9MOLU|nr:type II toxin-antitoxin system antitoxin SocA domain-containing protein [Candidatus Phytoplasma pruni]NWN45912.1 DUF4065 domain-containing protein [Candidatus Phytoplasma pruni]
MKNDIKINVFDVADYILEETEFKMTHMKLHKLIYYSHAKHLTTYKKPLIGEIIQAWKWGPVYPPLYHIFKDYSYENIRRKTQKGNVEKIQGSYKKAIDYIMEKYGPLNGQELSDRTHFEAPWQDAFAKGRETPIEDITISKFYLRKNKL